MAYSFTTLNAGDPISRDTVVANLDGIKVYAHKIETSALQAAQFVDTNHVMQPEYDPIRNVSTHVSGIYGGQNNGGVSLSFQFSTRWNSKVSDPKYRQPIPKTSLQIKFVRPCSYLFQWWANSFSKSDGLTPNEGETQICVYVTAPNFQPKTLSTLSVVESNNSAINQVLGGFNSSGFHAEEVQAEGALNIGLATASAANAYHTAWGFSLEAFFI
tara:strand:+ start:565 stop:1209 length:645 start_codon:yes stop_codon:yes gene_type:complete